MKRKNRSSKMKNKGMISLVIFIGLILTAYVAFFGKDSYVGNDGLPRYALKNGEIKEAYLFSRENPSALDGVKCYCGCMQSLHYGRIHKRGLLDCFVKENGDFDVHGSQCDMCVEDALQVKFLVGENKTKDEIKGVIDKKRLR